MSYGIRMSHQVFSSPPAEARELLQKAGASYVMFCGARGPRGLNVAERTRSLWGQIEAGQIPNWLERLPAAGPFVVFRLKP
jgi:hypothetical protein